MRIPIISHLLGKAAQRGFQQKLPNYVVRAFSSAISGSLSKHRFSLGTFSPLSMFRTDTVAKRTLSIPSSPDQNMLLQLLHNREWEHLERYIEGGIPESLAYTLAMAIPSDSSSYSDRESHEKVFSSLLKGIKEPSLKKEVVHRLIESAHYDFLPKALELLAIEKIDDPKEKENWSLRLAQRLLEGPERGYFNDRDPVHNLEKLESVLETFRLLGQIKDPKNAVSRLKNLTQRIYLGLTQPCPSSLRQICFCIGCLTSPSVRRAITTGLLQNPKYTQYEITSFLSLLHPFEEEEFLPELLRIAREQNLSHQYFFYREFFSRVRDLDLCEQVAEEYLRANPHNIIHLLAGLSCNEHFVSLEKILTQKLAQYPLHPDAFSEILEFWQETDPSGERIESLLSQNEPLRNDLLLYAIEHKSQNLKKLHGILNMLHMKKSQKFSEIRQAVLQPKTFLLTTPVGTLQCQRYSSTVLTVSDVLSKEECEHLCKKYEEIQTFAARSHLKTFQADQADLLQFCIHDGRQQNPRRDPVIDKLLRTMDGFLSALYSTELIESLPTRIDLDNDLEQLNIIRYEENIGRFDPHFDNETSLTDHYQIRNRLATILVYLNTVEEGGETEFVDTGISIRPETGKLLFFYNYNPNTQNPNTGRDPMKSSYIPWYPTPINEHAGRVPRSGPKMLASVFLAEHFVSNCRASGPRNSRSNLPLPIMPPKNQ